MKKTYFLLASVFVLLAFFTTTSAQITTTLKPGDKSTQVTLLQKILNAVGKSVAPTGPGSKGQETDEFGPSTVSAVKAFQCEKGIVCSGTPGTTGWGAVGPKTRGLLNSLGSSIAGFFSNIEGRSQLAGGIGDGTDASLISRTTFDGDSTPGVIGNAKTFNGTSDYIDIPESSALNSVSTGVAISAWVNFASPNTNTWQIIAGKLNQVGTNNYPYFQYMLGTDNSGQNKPRFFVTLGNNVVESITSNKAVAAGSWHHLVGTYDKQYLKIYVDGVLRGSLAKSSKIVTRNSPLRLGAQGAGAEFFKGAMDDVRVYNRGLTASEVAELYATRDGGGTTATDGACGTSNGGTFPSAPTSNLCSAGNASVVSLSGSTFSWNCASTNGGNTASCSATKSVTQTYNLTVTKAGTGTGTVSGGTISNCSSTCTQTGITSGDSIALSASPAANTSVVWTGCTTSSGNTCNVTMDAAKTVTAVFTSTGVRIDGSCGAAAKVYSATATFPSGALCATGTASAVTPVSGPISGSTAAWMCNGSVPPLPQGSNASCSASRQAVIQTNPSITSFTATPSSVTAGQTSLLKWSTSNATACTGTGFSTGNATSNTTGVSVSPTSPSTTYTLNCTGLAGTTAASQNVTVTVSTVPAPTATISASPTSITSGQSSTLTWSSTNATSCTASGSWTGSKATSGTQSVSPTANATYSITCTGAGGTTPSQSVSVSVGTVGGPEALPFGNGLAAAYPGDSGITGNSNVLFADDFESTSPLTGGGRWDSTSYGNGAVDATTAFAGSKSLKMTLPSGGGEVSNAVVKVISPSQDTLFVRAYTKFDPNYHVTTDSNHNGIRISANYTGPGYAPNGHDFFMFLLQNTQPSISNNLGSFYTNSFGDPGYYNVYSYYPEQRSGPLGTDSNLRANPGEQWGDSWFANGRIVPGDQTLGNFGPYFTSRTPINPSTNPASESGRPDGQWHSYEFMVKANTAGVRDGRVAYWIDGVLQGDFQNVYVRDAQGAAVKINKIMLELHAQGSPQDNYKWYDNVVVAKSYIGPMAPSVGGQTNPTASLTASPTSITSGQSSTLTWSSTNATGGCVGTGFSTGGATSGSLSVSPTANTTYSVSCTGAAGTTAANASATVTVGTVTNPPSIRFAVGDRVKVNNTGVATRSGPGTSFTNLGNHTIGNLGNIVSASDNGVKNIVDGFYWWKVNFDPKSNGTDPDGYTAEQFLDSVTTTGTATLTIDRTGNSSGALSATSPAGSVALSCANAPSCTAMAATVNVGTVVTLTATPVAGSVLTGWSGACSGTGNCVVTVNSNTTVTAQFDDPNAPIAGACGTSNGGTFSSTPATNLCSAGNASAVSLSGTTYGWSCGGTNGGTTASCTATKGTYDVTCTNGTNISSAIATALQSKSTVLVGPGSCNISGGVSLTGKTLKGAGSGTDGTVITGGTVTMTKSGSAVTRVEGFRFTGTDTHISVGGSPTARAYVIGNNYFNGNGSEFIYFGANGGLLHHNTFYMPPSTGGGGDVMQIKHIGEDWTQNPTFGNKDIQGTYGGERNIYFEDNTFNNITETAPDGDDGARLVMRNNIYNDSSIVFHGGRDTDTSDFGTRQFEIYGNTFNRISSGNNLSKLIWVRGGTGVIANNYFADSGNTGYSLNSVKLGVGCPGPYPVLRQIGQAYANREDPPTLPLLIFGNRGPGATGGSYYVVGENGTGGGGTTNCANPDNYVKVNRDFYLSNQWNWTPFTYPHPLTNPANNL